jgi:hypothetical protein
MPRHPSMTPSTSRAPATAHFLMTPSTSHAPSTSTTRCGYYYLIPQRLTTLIRRKILNSAIDVVSEALSMRMVPPAICTVVVSTGVTILLGLHNPPRSWTGTVGPSLPDFTIAPCVDSLLYYRSIRRPKSILHDSPKI